MARQHHATRHPRRTATLRRLNGSIDSLEPRRLLAAFTVDPSATPDATHFQTIASAIVAAAGTAETDDTIDVVAGSFAEDPDVNTPVTIRGARATNAGETILTGSFSVSAAGVTIDSFTIHGGSAAGSPPVVTGVYINADGATVSNNVLTGTANAGTGIIVTAAVGATGTTTLSNNTVEDWATGIDLRAGGAVGLIDNAVRDNSTAGIAVDLTAAATASTVTIGGSTFDNANAPQIALAGGTEGSDSVTLSNSTVTLRGTAAYVTSTAPTPVTGASSAAFTLVRSTAEDTTLLIDLDVDGTGFGTYNHVNLAGSASANDSIITYVPTANFNGPTGFDFTTMGGATGAVQITVTPVNDPPTVSQLIPPQAVVQGQTGTLSLANFFGDIDLNDATPDVLSYSISGEPGFVTLVSETGVLTFAPDSNALIGEHTFTVSASDGDDSVSQTITLTVHRPSNAAPVITNLPATLTFAEDQALGAIRTITATDADGDGITYSIVSGNDAGKFAIDPNTGELSLVAPLDAEQAQSYTLKIAATDDGDPSPASRQATLTVNVTDVNEAAGSVSVVGPAIGFEGSTITYNAVATDPDVGASFTYQWFVDGVEQAGETASSFSVSFPSESNHTISVTAIDRNGTPTTGSKDVAIADSPPNIPLSLSSVTVNEGSNFTLTIGSITDAGVGDTAEMGQLVIDWGDQSYTIINATSDATHFQDAIDGTPIQLDHTYSDGANDVRAITVRIWDYVGHAYSQTTSVTVNNVAPTGSFVALTPSVPAGTSAIVNWFGQGDVSAQDFAAGLRYTYAIDANGNGQYDVGETLIAGDGTYAGSTTLSQMTIPRTMLETAGTYNILGLLFDKDGSPFLTRTASVVVTAAPLRVISLGGDHSGFTATFNQPVDRSVINLYDGTDDANDTPDIVLARANGQTVKGSVIWAADGRSFDFIVTGGILSAGTYTVTMRSGSSAFHDTHGGLLDGDNNGTAGGTYTATFGVNAPPGPVLSMPDFARGPGQSVDVIPGNANSDLPVSVNTPVAISSFNFQIRYNSSLLTIRPADVANGIADVYAGAGLPAGWAVDYALGEGYVAISLTKTTPTTPDISIGSKELVKIRATVPNDPAIYGKSQYLSFASMVVNGNASIEGTADRAVHKAVFLGDANLDGTVNVADGSLIQSVVLGSVTGFDSYSLIDPVIIADSSRNAAVDAQDATNAVLSGFTSGRPADVPAFTTIALPGTIGADPTFQLGTLTPVGRGANVSVPITISDDARGVQSGTIRVNYDPTKLDLAGVPFTVGSLLGSGWTVLTNVNEAQGYIEIAFFSGAAFTGSSPITGTLGTLAFTTIATADGQTQLSIGTPSNQSTSPTVFFDKQGHVLATSAVSTSLIIDSVAPTTTGPATFNYDGAGPQSISITFNENVAASISALSFELLNRTTNTTIALTVAAISSDGRTVTLRFTGTGGVNGSTLTDGDYRFRVRAGTVSDAAGNAFASDADSTFFFANGDLNHDRTVGFDDLLALAKHYGSPSGATFSIGDCDYDGDVDFSDLLILAKNYGKTLPNLPPPVPSASANVSSPTRKRNSGVVTTID